MAAGLASAGANVLLVSRNEDEAKAAAATIEDEYPVKAVGIARPVNPAAFSEVQVAAMVARCMEEFGQIDILLNNADINIRGPIEELSLEDFRKVQSINVDAMWLCC